LWGKSEKIKQNINMSKKIEKRKKSNKNWKKKLQYCEIPWCGGISRFFGVKRQIFNIFPVTFQDSHTDVDESLSIGVGNSSNTMFWQSRFGCSNFMFLGCTFGFSSFFVCHLSWLNYRNIWIRLDRVQLPKEEKKRVTDHSQIFRDFSWVSSQNIRVPISVNRTPRCIKREHNILKSIFLERKRLYVFMYIKREHNILCGIFFERKRTTYLFNFF
jgi:hypothetical protein